MSTSVQRIFADAVIQWLSTHSGDATVAELVTELESEIGSGAAVVAPGKKVVKLVKKKKKKKDPNAPKNGKSAYLCFCGATRPQLKEAGVTGKDIMVKLGVMWNEPTLDKGPYNEMAAADKVRYAAEMAAYVAPVEGNI
jgi:hypothetical protein